MRNPDRIDVFCNRLAKVWKEQVPDWRFTQLLMNFLNYYGRDPFYMEDDRMIAALEEYIKNVC